MLLWSNLLRSISSNWSNLLLHLLNRRLSLHNLLNRSSWVVWSLWLHLSILGLLLDSGEWILLNNSLHWSWLSINWLWLLLDNSLLHSWLLSYLWLSVSLLGD